MNPLKAQKEKLNPSHCPKDSNPPTPTLDMNFPRKGTDHCFLICYYKVVVISMSMTNEEISFK